MGLHRIARVASAVGLLAAVGPVALWACDDDSTPAGPSPSPTTTLTTPTPGPIPSADGGEDGGGGDGGNGEPGVIPDKRTVKLVNLSEGSVNACIKSTAGGDFIGPLFRAAGVPTNAASERVLIDTIAGNGVVRIIAAGDTCAGTELGTITLPLSSQSEDSHLGVTYDALASQKVAGWFEHLTVTPGKESILTQALDFPLFTRDDGVGGAQNLRVVTGEPVLLDPDLVGKLTLMNVPDVERHIKTVAGGTLSLWATKSPSLGILLCDERAAAQDGLTNCSATLRIP